MLRRFHSWMNRFSGNFVSRAPSAAKTSRSFCLQIEGLEERLVLSANNLVPNIPIASPAHEVVHAGGTATPAGSYGPTGYQPAQIRHAYGIDQIRFSNGTVQGDGSGQTIAIIDAYDDPNIASDLAQF